ncbi:heterokaryon incompatibility protein-domain-containing protein [Cadophora sp. MPI-SDFR-AT-0126]|nr:heterokaryon incompatibility protein-domain-containing protein [Leotiomycetes sp. MPI-SDFR-AT-0126]
MANELSLDRYKYQPLISKPSQHAIRLLTLYPAPDPSMLIACNLTHACLEETPDFSALSYTWGITTSPTPISLSGHPHIVTTNLASALRHLRLPDRARTLWVDALCIDQTNVKERSEQVSLMREIYDSGGSRKVIVWLGEEGSAQSALDICRGALSVFPVPNHVLTEYHEEWQACNDLFIDRPWWSRAWILQEVIHSGEVMVHIGQLPPLSIDELCDFFKRYRSTLTIRETVLAKSKHIISSLSQTMVSGIPSSSPAPSEIWPPPPPQNWNLWLRTGDYAKDPQSSIGDNRLKFKDPLTPTYQPSLASLLIGFRNQQATDPLDKIYAFLGMAIKEFDIPVDYGLTKRQLYTHVARALLRKVLLILLWVESPHRSVQRHNELPSWVPDFTISQGLVPRSMFAFQHLFDADKGFPAVNLEPRFAEPKDSETLVIRGIYVATITGVHDCRITTDDELLGLDALRLIQYDRNPSSRSLKPNTSPPEGACNCLQPEPHISPPSFKNTSWGPVVTEIGDIIIVSPGLKIPIVLRKIEDGYLWVGGCWLIDSEIRDLENLGEDPAFSPIMFGIACAGLPEDNGAETFRIY